MANQTESSNNKPFVWVAVLAVIGLAVVALCAINNQPTGNTGRETQNLLVVTGTHVLEVAPDEAVLTIEVVTNASTAQDASNQNRVLTSQVMNALKAEGLVDADIETTNVYLQKKTEWVMKEQEYVDRGYEQRTTLKVTVRDLSKVGSVLDAAVGAGANGVQDISFQLQPATENKYKEQVLADATKIATSKAKILADAAGADLGHVASISENSYNYLPYVYNAKRVVGSEADAADATSQISPEKVSISVSVTVGYELE